MIRITLLLRNRIFFTLVLLALPSAALAMLIYDWVDAEDPDSTVTGSMIFADGVSFGDIVDPLSDKLLEFSFSNPTLPDWSMSDFAYGHFLRPETAGVELDTSEFADASDLAIPTDPGDPTKKSAAKKKVATKGGIFYFERDDAYLEFAVAGSAKKKAAKKTAAKKKAADPAVDPLAELFPLWTWSSSVPPVECPPGTACKKSATEPHGEGYWVLRSGTVPVPEPTTFLLLLAGLGVMLSVVKRIRGRH